jgi:hypothetical protein
MEQDSLELPLEESQALDSVYDGRIPPPLGMVFDSLDDADPFVRSWAIDHGYCVIRRTSEKDKKAIYICKQGGEYESQSDGKRDASTMKCGCTFQFGIYVQTKSDNKWKISYTEAGGKHTCEPIDDVRCFPQARKLPADLEDVRRTLAQSGIDSVGILSVLQTLNPTIRTYIKDISNLSYKDRSIKVGLNGIVHAAIKFLEEENYSYAVKCDADKNLTHLFFINNKLLSLARSFHSVFVMDCTYRTNDYDVPLLNIVGVDCFTRTFNAGFCFMTDETENSYRWAMDQFDSIVLQCNITPKVIITDQDAAIINAILYKYPNVFHQLCRWHISKNVQANCRPMFGAKNAVDKFNDFYKDWHVLCYSKSEEDFNSGWLKFKETYNTICEEAVIYLERQWITKKQKFVDYYLDKVMNLGMRATSRVEGNHCIVKKHLRVRDGNLLQVLERINIYLKKQIEKYEFSFGKAVSSTLTSIGENDKIILKLLEKKVSFEALKLLCEQLKLMREGAHIKPCTNVFHNTMGLPCCHRIYSILSRGKTIEPDDVHKQWIPIHWQAEMNNATIQDNEETSLNVATNQVLELLNTFTPEQKQHVLASLTQQQEEEITSPIQIIKEPIKQTARRYPKKNNKETNKSNKRAPSLFEIEEKAFNDQHQAKKQKRVYYCHKCGKPGHNKAKCPSSM